MFSIIYVGPSKLVNKGTEYVLSLFFDHIGGEKVISISSWFSTFAARAWQFREG